MIKRERERERERVSSRQRLGRATSPFYVAAYLRLNTNGRSGLKGPKLFALSLALRDEQN
jgi:hypothetical protein